MNVSVIDGLDLGAAEIARWREIRDGNDDFASPFLTPEYVTAVASVRPGIRVAVMRDGNRIEGFFPYQEVTTQEVTTGVAEAVGDKISDCHAAIVRPGFPWTAGELLRGAGLTAWHYRRVPISQSQFHRFHEEQFHSPLVDLSGGFEAYAAARRSGGSRVLVKAARARELLERAAGPLRYDAQSANVGGLQALMRCKSEQYRRTDKFDRFSLPWVVALLERLQATRTKEFAGMLSVLWAGSHMAAAHFGMRSSTVWNYWFPCFNREFARFSPGLILLAEILRSAESMGIPIVELGAGEADYKLRFANSARVLARGSATATAPERTP